MIIGIGEETKKWLRILNLEYPFTKDSLKKQFRLAAMTAHPDRRGSNDRMRNVLDAYKYLKNLALVEEGDSFVNNELKRRGRFDIPCSICSGSGKCSVSDLIIPCSQCIPGDLRDVMKRGFEFKYMRMQDYPSKGYFFKTCTICKGTGKGRGDNNCPACDGSKMMKQRCSYCHGEGTETIVGHQKDCFYCSGKGYQTKEPFNPVIPEQAILTPRR